VLGYLRDRGATDDRLARVHAPAGLDLGKIAHEEIAVAILAELVQERAAGRRTSASPTEVPTHEAIDPVCGMTVDVGSAVYRSTYEDATYFFCSAGCLQRFREEPARFSASVRGI
jgi:xanthine dehydrogenase accessory factor